MVALCGRKSPILKRASPKWQIFLTLDSGPANLADFREFTCLLRLQPLEGLKDGVHPGLLCSPASTSGKEQRALCSLAHPQLRAGQGTRPQERLTRPRACPAVHTALLWAPAPRWRGAPRPWLWAPPGSCPGWEGAVRIHHVSSSTAGLHVPEQRDPQDHWVERGKWTPGSTAGDQVHVQGWSHLGRRGSPGGQ